MRTLMAMLLFALTSCDTLWAPYIEKYSSDSATKDGFPGSLEVSYPLGQQYMLMATGNYDGDPGGVADVAVSGLFEADRLNPSMANPSAVEIYLGDGQGGLRLDGTCLASPMERVVYLLTVPSAARTGLDDILVATEDSSVFLCTKASGAWTASPIKTSGGVFNGFKLLALAYGEPQGSLPDLVVRTGINRFTDRSTTTSSLHVYRADAPNSFGKMRIPVSTADITWVLPYRFGNASGDSLAITWDNPTVNPGVNFRYIAQDNIPRDQGSGQTAAANVTGTPFPELKNVAFTALASLHTLDPVDETLRTSILFTDTQDKNSVAVMYGQTVEAFGIQAQQTNLMAGGFMLPYAGDADGDKNDEIGLYTAAPNRSPLIRHLMILSYKKNNINLSTPIADIANPTENFRAMALEYLGDTSDLRRQRLRKDLIALVEDPVKGSSRLMVRRSDLSYQFP